MRNNESHFSVNPVNIDMQRSRFDRPFNHTFTGKIAQLIPFFCQEVLPGDTVKMSTSKVVRLLTLDNPVFGNLYLDTYYFFVPMRLTWDHTKEFFGENTTGPWAPATSYTIPQISSGTTGGFRIGSVADYMGIPPKVENLSVNALPIRAYNICYRDWFMSEPLETPPNIYTGDSTVTYVDASNYGDATKGGFCWYANKLFDYFTSCLPAPQRGSSVTVPLGGNIQVSGSNTKLNVVGDSNTHAMSYTIALGNSSSPTNANVLFAKGDGYYGEMFLNLGSNIAPVGTAANRSNLVVTLPNMQANLSNATPISVNDLRMAFQLQKWYEKSALYGGRYIEMLKAQFGVTSPDARLQRSEYLGGNRVPIQIHQVENNAAGGSVPLGKLGAYSATSDVNEDFTHSFTENGYLIGVCCLRYNHVYSQGLERFWNRRTMFDFYFPVMANIGNQAVLNKEIYAAGDSSDDGVFGFQEAWADYRYIPDRCSAFMRPNVPESLGKYWTWADEYDELPTLSEEWIGEDPYNVQRTLSVVDETEYCDVLFDYYCDSTWTRVMPLYSIPGLIDHH